MTPRARLRIALSTVLVIAVAPALSIATGDAAAAHSLGYRQVSLGSLGGGATRALAINDRGQVVGQSQTSTGRIHPFLWQRGQIRDLGVLTPGPDDLGIAHDVNAGGDVVGGSDAAGGMHATLWRAGHITDLGTLGGGYSFANAINDYGDIVGVSETATGELRGFLWRHGHMTGLNIPGPTDAVDINNRGQIVGWSGFGTDGAYQPFLWQLGTTTRLSMPGPRGQAAAINDHGDIAGSVALSADPPVQAVLWRHGVPLILGTLPGGNASAAVAVNDRRQVLGSGNVQADSDEEHPFVWARGALRDLTTAGVPADAAYFLTGINDKGQIVAAGTLFTPA